MYSQQDELSGLRSEETVFTIPRMIVQSPELPIESPFSPGILAGNTLYMAGQMGRGLRTGKIPKTIEDQTRVAMKNVERILTAISFDYRWPKRWSGLEWGRCLQGVVAGLDSLCKSVQ